MAEKNGQGNKSASPTEQNEKLNIYRLAELAGTSPATVSKVLNEREGVSDRMRKHVLKVAAEMHFAPAIVANERKNIAFVYSAASENIFSSEFLSKLLHSCSESILDMGYRVLLVDEPDIPRDKYEFAAFCNRQSICGVIFCSLKLEDDYVLHLAGHIPLVCVNITFPGDIDRLYSISSDDYNGMSQVIHRLHECGHRKIGLIAEDWIHESNRDKVLAFYQAQKERGLPVLPEWVIRTPIGDGERICRQLDNLRAMEKLPTAFVCLNDRDACHMIRYAQQVDIRCPEDISITGYDDYHYVQYMTPSLTTVRQMLVEKGELAAKLACGRSPETLEWYSGTNHFSFGTMLVNRGSVRRIDTEE